MTDREFGWISFASVLLAITVGSLLRVPELPRLLVGALVAGTVLWLYMLKGTFFPRPKAAPSVIDERDDWDDYDWAWWREPLTYLAVFFLGIFCTWVWYCMKYVAS